MGNQLKKMYGGDSGGNQGATAMYDRGGMAEQHEEKKHIGSAILMFLSSATLLAFYSHWLQQVNESSYNCCAYYNSSPSVRAWLYGECQRADFEYVQYHVTAEFYYLNVWGVTLMVFMVLTALGHIVKPLRCFTKIFGTLVWVFMFILFICANVYRFREAGRACSLDYVNGNYVTAYGKQWWEQGRFQMRMIAFYYCALALGIVVACIAAVCCRKKKQTMY